MKKPIQLAAVLILAVIILIPAILIQQGIFKPLYLMNSAQEPSEICFGEKCYSLEEIESPQKLCLRETCYNLEVAVSPEERTQGLKFRSNLSKDSGMLFIFPEKAKHTFWMKDTIIPLDIIWLDEDYNVVHIVEGAQPCKELPCELFNPQERAVYVLEINSGESRKLDLKIGDTFSS